MKIPAPSGPIRSVVICVMLLISMSRALHMNGSCMRTSHVTHMHETCRIHMNEPCVTYEQTAFAK